MEAKPRAGLSSKNVGLVTSSWVTKGFLRFEVVRLGMEKLKKMSARTKNAVVSSILSARCFQQDATMP